MTIGELYRRTITKLSPSTDEAEAEAREIMAHVYGMSWGMLIMRLFDAAGPAEMEQVRAAVQRRLTGMPLAYVLESRGFYGLDFHVDPRVLIPRYDTEWVAQAAVEAARRTGARTAADICCGSGCLGIVLLHENAVRSVTFTDIDEGAAAVAAMNLQRLCPGADAQILTGDLLAPLEGSRFDLVVSNPPYVSDGEYETLEPAVRCFEPRKALAGGPDGLDFYRRLTNGVPDILEEGGVLITEIGCTQAEQVAELFGTSGFDNVSVGRDLEGRPRWVQGELAPGGTWDGR